MICLIDSFMLLLFCIFFGVFISFILRWKLNVASLNAPIIIFVQINFCFYFFYIIISFVLLITPVVLSTTQLYIHDRPNLIECVMPYCAVYLLLHLFLKIRNAQIVRIYQLFPLHIHRYIDTWKQRNYVLQFSLALVCLLSF